MKEYQLVVDTSFSGKNDQKKMQSQINEMAKLGFKIISTCALENNKVSRIYIFFEKDV